MNNGFKLNLYTIFKFTNALFHFSGILSSQNDHFMALEVEDDRGGWRHSGGVSVCRELSGIVNGEVGLTKLRQFLFGGSNEHVSHEESVIGSCAHNAHFDAVSWVPAGVAVKNVQTVAGVEVVNGTFPINHESMFGQLDIDRPPPNIVDGTLLLHDALVLWRTALFGTRIRHQGSGKSERCSLFVCKRLFVQDGDTGYEEDDWRQIELSVISRLQPSVCK